MFPQTKTPLMPVDQLASLVNLKIINRDTSDAERAWWLRMVNVYADAAEVPHRWSSHMVASSRRTGDGRIIRWSTDGTSTQVYTWRDDRHRWGWEDTDTPVYAV